MEKNKNIERIMSGAAFTLFMMIACYKLTNAPLWFDETIEYWYSKIMFGKIPFERAGLDASTNMYQRIVSTYQPPLYNVVMHFWLKLGTTEWWFRFFGVVMGTVGNIGIYKAVKKVSNSYIAASAVFFSACVFQLVYYWQECAEYCLMLGTLCWAIYAFICLLAEQSLRNIIMFTILSILPVYSQYGAAFPVLAMIIIAYVYTLMARDKKSIISLTISYLVAFVGAALPLFYFFMIKQMRNQQGGNIEAVKFTVENNVFVDMFNSFKTIVWWNLFSYYNELVSVVFSWFFIFCIALSILFSRKIYVKLIAFVNVISWVLYYIAVKLGMYSYGSFGSRYNLFFIPLWIISLFCFGYQLYELLKNSLNEKLKNSSYIYTGVCISMILCFMVTSWTMKLQYNWSKEDMRSAVKTWLEVGAQNSQTIVYYGGDSGFAYYVRANENYSPEMENNVVYMPWMRDKSVEEYTDYINSLYADEWPIEIYIIGTHTRADINTLASAFTDRGYIREDLNTSNCTLMRLIYMESE